MPNIQHFAFKRESPNLLLKLVTEVEICDASQPQNAIKVRALWDTGASGSVITPEVAQKLSLVPFDRTKINGVNSISMADLVKASLRLPNLVVINNISVSVCNLVKDVDLLIGMDIIQLGDFSISNGAGKTLFTFAMPPFEDKTDLHEKAIATNKSNYT